MSPPQVTAADDARRIRMMLAQTVMNMQRTLQQVSRITENRGRKQMDAALGTDAAQLPAVYKQLKMCLEALDPTAKIPELPH
jgi:hypothetical protein